MKGFICCKRGKGDSEFILGSSGFPLKNPDNGSNNGQDKSTCHVPCTVKIKNYSGIKFCSETGLNTLIFFMFCLLWSTILTVKMM
jgi:hypothetical protein